MALPVLLADSIDNYMAEVHRHPILSAEEILDLPPGEQRRLGAEDSPLASFASANFPVYFLIP